MAARTATKLQTGTLVRSVQLDRSTFDKEKRTVRVRFSSEQPVSRWFGDEVLSHDEKCVDLSRMKNGAAVLVEHDPKMRCGITESAEIINKTGEAVIRLARNAMGDQCLAEIEDGTLRWVSVGYTVERFEVDDKETEYKAIEWTPLEVSLVSIPADTSAKVLRSTESGHESMVMKRALLEAQGEQQGNGSATIITSEDLSREMDEGREILTLAAQYQAKYPELIQAAERAIKDKWGIRKWQAHLLKVATKPATAMGAEVIASARGVRGDCSVGGRFVNSQRYQEMVKGGLGRGRHVEVEIEGAYGFRSLDAMQQRVTFGIATSDVSGSTDIGGTSGAGIDIIRQPWNLLNQQPLSIADLFAQGTTGADVVRYIRELSFTNAADRVAEAGPKPQAQLDIGVINGTVEKTAVYVDVSEEMMNDWQQAGSFINSRLSYMVQAKEDSFLLNGTGSNQITGILNFTGIQTISGATSTVDQLLRAKAYVEGANGAGFAMPDAYVMNPLDYLNVRLTKDANGQYLLGGPGYAPYGVGGYTNVGQLWGLPVVTSVFLAQGTAIVGAFKMGAQIFRRAGVTIRTTDSDGSKFLSNIITVVAESRFMLACYQPNRFCTITNIPG